MEEERALSGGGLRMADPQRRRPAPLIVFLPMVALVWLWRRAVRKLKGKWQMTLIYEDGERVEKLSGPEILVRGESYKRLTHKLKNFSFECPECHSNEISLIISPEYSEGEAPWVEIELKCRGGLCLYWQTILTAPWWGE